MLSTRKLNALRLSLQPLTSINSSAYGPTPTAVPITMPPTPAPLSASIHPKKPRLSPVPDSNLCSPTPTRAAFLLTPTRYGLRRRGTDSNITSPITSTSPVEAISPLLSTCVCEGCQNPVQSERNTCSACREVFYDILAKQIGMVQMRSPMPLAKASRNTTEMGAKSPVSMHIEDASETSKVDQVKTSDTTSANFALSVTHPRPNPIAVARPDSLGKNRTRGLPEPDSPDALYFGKKRSRQTYKKTKKGGQNQVTSSANIRLQVEDPLGDVKMTE